MAKRTVEKAAILYNGEIFSVDRPKRHPDVIKLINARFGIDSGWRKNAKQGFVLSDGTFVDRYVARDIAEDAGQLITPLALGHALTSEDVW